jgi:hypothetical protein
MQMRIVVTNKAGRILQAAACSAVCVAGVMSARHAWTAPESSTPTARHVADDVLPPMANEPQTSAGGVIVPVSYRTWLDPARINAEPRLLPKDGIHPLRPRPAIDLPPVAQAAAGLPTHINLPAAPRVRWISPDPADVTSALTTASDAGRANVLTDDTLNLAPPGALQLTPPPRKVPAPFLLLALPDPTRQGGEIHSTMPIKEDPPVPSFDRPAKPTLPAGK